MPTPKSDAARFREVAETIRALGMRTGLVVVGDIKVVLAEPWGADPPQTRDSEQRQYVVDASKAEADADLKELRTKSRKQFGRVLPDEQLKRMRGVL